MIYSPLGVYSVQAYLGIHRQEHRLNRGHALNNPEQSCFGT
jgi:hypothetical protein